MPNNDNAKNSEAIKQIDTLAKEAIKLNLHAVPSKLLLEIIADPAAQINHEHQMEVWKVEAPLKNAANLEMFKSIIEAGQTAIKTGTVINGGAALGLLAFIGNLATKQPGQSVEVFSNPLVFFMAGVASAGICSVFRYLSQAGYQKNESLGDRWKTAAITTGTICMACFIAGCWCAYQAFLTIGTLPPTCH